MSWSTPEPLRRYLSDLVAVAGEVLGAELCGAYAAGSVGLAAYQPGRSDVDVALICAGPLDHGLAEVLVTRLRHEALPCPARGLELVVYQQEVARSGTPEPGFEVELNTGARMDFRVSYEPAQRPSADGLFWYGLDRSILHQSGWALLGPPAADAFADLTPEDLRRLVLDALRWWWARPAPAEEVPVPGADDAVLGACRSWVRLRTGVWLPKVAAGRRLLDQAGPLVDADTTELVERSVAARDGGVPPSGAAARAFQRRVLADLTAAPA
ncbi:nucleotidyltransferase domain-containing protein [Verrucosispora sp. WMMD573]|uniref:nucleotidyltransferase domain-containing protein n=1 Tax=Verrucosispora sp. WMMD573 TaxID=3015149 RepID=UPI00248C5284|nr:nucleotidyltransferase domain-containing protein [Verrucosispora sp. WMMD573]WBB54331.1 nucleotidyltransferase domain-containing protein [Verrucosispora sp. WMMD573]